MAKLIQICASENDLFGLDGEGGVYQFDFSTNDWMKLGRNARRIAATADVPAGGGPRRLRNTAEAEPLAMRRQP
jgi:hypothetical protein